MTKTIALLVFLISGPIAPLLAQKEANVWVFERDVGIDFNYNRFTPFNGTGMDQSGGSASICDKNTGQLLFYTDGRHVWNRKFKLMPNGTGLRGGFATTQAALIVPYPGRDNLYYIFTTKSFSDTIPLIDSDSNFNGLYYSIVDMDLDRGYGDVVKGEKNILLMERATEKLTAIPHANGKGFWLITHEWGSNRFVVFPVDGRGVGAQEYFAIGSHYGHYESQGWLLPSPNGRMIASAVYSGDSRLLRPLELYRFDAASGAISDLKEIGHYGRLFGVSFSPDNSKLYFTYADQYDPSTTFGGLFQVDLSSGNSEEIVNSLTELYFLHETGLGGYDTLTAGCLQLAPDGRLYVAMTGLYLGEDKGKRVEKIRIFYLDKPNEPGWDSQPSSRLFRAKIFTSHTLSFPNFMQHYFQGLEPKDNFTDIDDCRDEFTFGMFPNPTKGFVRIKTNNPNCLYPAKISIYNSIGQFICSHTIYDETVPILDLTDLASAVYIIKLELPFNIITLRLMKI
jgi:hypothetical protein